MKQKNYKNHCKHHENQHNGLFQGSPGFQGLFLSFLVAVTFFASTPSLSAMEEEKKEEGIKVVQKISKDRPSQDMDNNNKDKILLEKTREEIKWKFLSFIDELERAKNTLEIKKIAVTLNNDAISILGKAVQEAKSVEKQEYSSNEFLPPMGYNPQK